MQSRNQTWTFMYRPRCPAKIATKPSKASTVWDDTASLTLQTERCTRADTVSSNTPGNTSATYTKRPTSTLMEPWSRHQKCQEGAWGVQSASSPSSACSLCRATNETHAGKKSNESLKPSRQEQPVFALKPKDYNSPKLKCQAARKINPWRAIRSIR